MIGWTEKVALVLIVLAILIVCVMLQPKEPPRGS